MINRDYLALIGTGLVSIGFLVAGIFNVLDYLIIKAILFGAFATLFLFVLISMLTKPEDKENYQQ
ncbi:hypothetical protein [Winogradskyella sp. 3972H.M.0a.05]|uniref:hypothetical protein n=1 Tax=Winogradskyella sp. 3972H.M.0a.05 TaxID=2950277 RepID=UPI003393E15D